MSRKDRIHVEYASSMGNLGGSVMGFREGTISDSQQIIAAIETLVNAFGPLEAVAFDSTLQGRLKFVDDTVLACYDKHIARIQSLYGALEGISMYLEDAALDRQYPRKA